MVQAEFIPPVDKDRRRYMDPPLIPLFREQARVIHALMIRETYTRFGRDNIGFAWLIVEPAMFALFVVGLWSIIGHGGHNDIPIAPFLFCGYMPLLTYRHMVSHLVRCMQANSDLLYHRQIKTISLYVSRLLVEFLGTSAAFVFCMVSFWVAGFVNAPDNLGLMIGGWMLYAWYSAASAIAVGALSERSEIVEKLWNPISYIMIPLSGTFFMVEWLPAGLRDVITWSPPVNGVEMLRAGYFGPGVTTHFHWIYLFYVDAVISVIALFLLKGARRYVEVV